MSNKTVSTRILLKRDTYANWSTKNPTLSAGEYSYDTTNKIIKVGDGATKWNTLDSIHVLSSNVEDLIGIINNQVAEGNVVLSNDLMSDHIDALKTNVQTAQTTATEAATAAATAQTTATEAKTTAEGASTSVTTLNTKVGDIPSTATSTTVVGYVDERIAQSAAGVRFRGVFNSLEEVQDPLNGDVVIIRTTGEGASTKEYIYSKPTAEATGEWIELGDENLYETKAQAAAKLAEAKAYADGLAVNYDPAGSAATAKTEAIASAKTYSDGLAVNYDPAGSAATAEANAKTYADGVITDVTFDCGSSVI